MIEWRAAVLAEYCVTCNAKPGESCKSVRGNPRFECHAARTQAAQRTRDGKSQWL